MSCRAAVDTGARARGEPLPAAALRTLAAFCNRRWALLSGTLALLLIAYHVAAVLRFGAARVDGKVYALVSDDMMISMRYGRNLARGDGLVYNPGERVEGFTNPLTTLFAAGVHLLPLRREILPFSLHLLNLGISLAILFGLLGFWGREPTARLAGLLAAWAYVTLPNHSYHAHAGFEAYMHAGLLLFGLGRIERLGYAGSAAIGLLPLVHGTAMGHWALLVAALVLWPGRTLGKRLTLALMAIAPFSAYAVLRMAYYGELLPNTYWVKVGTVPLSVGLEHVAEWAAVVSPLLLLAGGALLVLPRWKGALMAASVVLHAGGVAWVGGDHFPQHRFLVPVSVVLAALSGRGLVALWERAAAVGKPRLRRAACALLAAMLAAGTAVVPYFASRAGVEKSKEFLRFNLQHLGIGLAVNASTPADAVVALFGLGYAGYCGDRYVIDMLGKTDRHIARARPNRTRTVGHNRTDFDYVLARAPDLINLWCTPAHVADREFMAGQQAGPWNYFAELAQHPTFKAQYLPHPVAGADGVFLHLYARSAPGARGWQGAWGGFLTRPRSARHESDAR